MHTLSLVGGANKSHDYVRNTTQNVVRVGSTLPLFLLCSWSRRLGGHYILPKEEKLSSQIFPKYEGNATSQYILTNRPERKEAMENGMWLGDTISVNCEIDNLQQTRSTSHQLPNQPAAPACYVIVCAVRAKVIVVQELWV
jgi:hypothetical protein